MMSNDTGLATTTALNAAKNEIPSVSNLVKKKKQQQQQQQIIMQKY